jgi:formyltetrahydrofolate hydrolase
VVASLAQLLFGFGCNIIQSDQFSDDTLSPSRFFQVRACVRACVPVCAAAMPACSMC